jgi:hypothetical protein
MSILSIILSILSIKYFIFFTYLCREIYLKIFTKKKTMNLKVKTSVGAVIFLCRDFFRDRPARKALLMDRNRAFDEFGTIFAERERESI